MNITLRSWIKKMGKEKVNLYSIQVIDVTRFLCEISLVKFTELCLIVDYCKSRCSQYSGKR